LTQLTALLHNRSCEAGSKTSSPGAAQNTKEKQMHTEPIESSSFNATEAYFRSRGEASAHCCVCGTKREVKPCANVDCDKAICESCQGPNSVASHLGTCDEETCAVQALRDLREMYAARIRRAEHGGIAASRIEATRELERMVA
jgi:hypothetical protein